jgi:hypothetical protein
VQQSGYRPQMRNGITLTGNSDQMYVGQLYHGVDYTDAAIVWSDNAGGWLADRLTFNFTSSYNPSATAGNNSMRGLQTFLIQPAASGDEAFVGIGDFDAVSETPAERLDMLNGRVRIRQLPTSPAAGTLTRYMVVDDDGVVHWRALPPAVAGCEWDQFGAADHLRTAWSGAALGCPDENSHVGIGTAALPGKLTVVEAGAEAGPEYGIHVTMHGDASGVSHGALVHCEPAAEVVSPVIRGAMITGRNGTDLTEGINVLAEHLVSENEDARAFAARCTTRTTADLDEALGVQGDLETHGEVRNAFGLHGGVRVLDGEVENGFAVYGRFTGRALRAYGVRGETRMTSSEAQTALERFGVHGAVAHGLAPFSCGVFGSSYAGGMPSDPPLGTIGSWAGYFQGLLRVTGNAYVNGNVLVTSDASLKTDISEISDATGLIASLNPRSYHFIPQDHPHMQLPEARQWGLIAQELQEVLPELVEEVAVPAVYDSLFNLTAEATSHLAVNYIGLIPILIAGHQEQQATIAQQEEALNEVNERLAQLEAALAACCTADAKATDANDLLNGDGTPAMDPALDRLLTIAPNPFTDHTTVHYTLERPGRAQLLVNSADGRHIEVLHEGVMPAGAHRYEWSTAHLAPGVHYVTLLLDGEHVVKRAVKVR